MAATKVDIQAVRSALSSVEDPELKRGLVDLGMVRDVKIDGSTVTVTVALTTPECPLKDRISGDVREAVGRVAGVAEVAVRLIAMTNEERMRVLGESASDKVHPAQLLNRIGQVIAVMSGKGGVGKSLVTGLLAVALVREGKRVGILDADVTGPSIPKMFGLHGRLEADSLGIYPMQTPEGIGVISMNCLLEREDDAVIWRGPLIGSAITQFWQDGMWGDLDYLLVDLPPGTSDAPLTVLQSLPVAGVVVVSSPQELARVIVRKAVTMLREMRVPIAGVVENMSYYVCPELGVRHEVFGPSRGAELAAAADAPLLACLPLDPTISALCDAGRIAEYDAPAYRELAKSFLEIGVPRLVARAEVAAR